MYYHYYSHYNIKRLFLNLINYKPYGDHFIINNINDIGHIQHSFLKHITIIDNNSKNSNSDIGLISNENVIKKVLIDQLPCTIIEANLIIGLVLFESGYNIKLVKSSSIQTNHYLNVLIWNDGKEYIVDCLIGKSYNFYNPIKIPNKFKNNNNNDQNSNNNIIRKINFNTYSLDRIYQFSNNRVKFDNIKVITSKL